LFVVTAGSSLGHDNTKNGGIQTSEDNDLDLAEADFAPAHCSVLFKPCAVNGNDFDSPAFSTAASDLTFPAHNAVNDGVTSSSNSNTTSDSVQNDEASATASVHYDAIGLPLCTEYPVSDGHEAVTSQNSDLSPWDVAVELNVNSDNHVLQHDLDSHVTNSGSVMQNDVVSTEGLSTSALSVSSTDSASLSFSDRHIAGGCDDEFDSHIMTDKTVTCEESDAVEELNTCDKNVVGRILSNANDLEYKPDNTVELSQQNIDNINQDINDAEPPLGMLRGTSFPFDHDSLSALQTISEIQREATVSADGDGYNIQLSLMDTEDVEDMDDGLDEVDKTVPSLYQTSISKSFDTGSLSHEADHLSDDDYKKPVDLTSSEAFCMEKEFDEMCGIDHVERITVDNFSKTRTTVEIDSCSDVCGKDKTDAECTSESCLITNSHKTMELNEADVTAVEPMVYETGSYDTDTVTSSVPMQSLDDIDHPATSVPCSVSTADAVVVYTDLSPIEKEPVDGADMHAADGQKEIDSLETLQKHDVSQIYAESLEVNGITQQDNWPLLVNNAGDAQNAEVHQELLKQSGDDGDSSLLGVISHSVAVNTEPSTNDELLMAKALSEVQPYSGPLSKKTEDLDPAVDLITSVASTEQEVHLSAVVRTVEEQEEKCSHDNNVMPNVGLSEKAGQDLNQLDISISSETLLFVHDDADAKDSIDKDESVVETETESKLIHDAQPLQDQQRLDAKRQSDVDAEKWFEEQFEACEDFNVEEFVSSAWSEFHLDAADLEDPTVGNIHNEMLEQALAAASDYKPVQVDTADAWQQVENAAVAGCSAVDLCSPTSDEYPHYLDNEMEVETCSSPSYQPEAPQTVSSAPGNYLFHNYTYLYCALN